MVNERANLLCWSVVVCACGCSSNTDAASGSAPQVLTDVRVLRPVVPALSEPTYPSLIDPAVRRTLLLKGYGDWQVAPGEPCVDHYAEAEPPPPPRGAHAKLLLRFAQLPDLNLVDDESPGRAVNTDQPVLFTGPFRPQETELCRMANAMVQTLNRVHAQTPLRFVLLGGNLIDNAQQNELDWALQILGGAERVECDSGRDDDLVLGVDDGKDPFVAPGLDMPFYWVTGNHDLLMQGMIPVDEVYRQIVIGSVPFRGFELRDFSQPGGPAGGGPVPEDAARRYLNRNELLQRVLAHGDGHGLSEAQVASGKAFYTFDVEGTPLRFVVLDTATETGGAEGLLRRADLDEHVRPALEQARDDRKWVILASHHPTSALSDGRGWSGSIQADAISSREWLRVLGEYPNILFGLAAHEHADREQWLQPEGGHAFWELTSAALGDYPHQARIFELWDEDNGYVSLQAIYVDMDLSRDPVAEQGRHLGLMDYTSGWNPQFGAGRTEQRNVRLFAKTP